MFKHQSPTPSLIKAVQTWCETQSTFTVPSELFQQWFYERSGSGSAQDWMVNLGIDEDRAAKAADFLEKGAQGTSDGMVACVEVAAQLLANNHLPPARIRLAMRREFQQGSLRDLYHSIKEGTSFSERAFVEKVDRLGL